MRGQGDQVSTLTLGGFQNADGSLIVYGHSSLDPEATCRQPVDEAIEIRLSSPPVFSYDGLSDANRAIVI
jgi:hypothetical protein